MNCRINSTNYGLFFSSNSKHGGLWSFEKGDIIDTDSSFYKVVDIILNSNTAVIEEVDCCPQIESDTSRMCIYRDSLNYALEKGAMRFIDNTSSTATFRYYKTTFKKLFTSNGDTCIMEGRGITYLHLKIPYCGDLFIKDTNIQVGHNSVIRTFCKSDPIQILGQFECSTLKLTIHNGDAYDYRPLVYQGNIDSSDVTLSLGDVYTDEENGEVITLAWTVADGFLKNLAGFNIYSVRSSSEKKRPSQNSVTKNQKHESITNYNIIGKKLPYNIYRKPSGISKRHNTNTLIIW